MPLLFVVAVAVTLAVVAALAVAAGVCVAVLFWGAIAAAISVQNMLADIICLLETLDGQEHYRR